MAVPGFDSPSHLRPHQPHPSPRGAADAGTSCDLQEGIVDLHRRVRGLTSSVGLVDDPFSLDMSPEDLFDRLYDGVTSECWEQVHAYCQFHRERLPSLIDDLGRTVFDAVVYSGNLEATRRIIEEPSLLIALSAGGQHQETLPAAVRSGHPEILEFLVGTGKFSFCYDRQGQKTPLHIAIDCNDLKMVRILRSSITHRESLMPFTDTRGRSFNSLAYAVKLGRPEILDDLIDSFPTEILRAVFRSVEGIGNVFHVAIFFDNGAALEVLLNKAIKDKELMGPLLSEINYPFSKEDRLSGLTPLQLAAATYNDFALSSILKAFPDHISKLNPYGNNRTVVHTAAIFNFEMGIKKLRHLGANFDLKDLSDASAKNYLEQTNPALLSQLETLAEQVDRLGVNYEFLPPKNLVLSGGGPKGLAYVGALKALEEKNLIKHVERICGTSAGAITAALLSVGMSSDEINAFLEANPLHGLIDIDPDLPDHIRRSLTGPEFDRDFAQRDFFRILGNLGFSVLKHEAWVAAKNIGKQTILKSIGRPIDPMEPFRKLFSRIQHMPFKGFCTGEKLRREVERKITEKTGKQFCTFGELKQMIYEHPRKYRDLYIYGTNATRSKPVLFSTEDENCRDLIISDVVRLSMSIPAVFQPHRLYKKVSTERADGEPISRRTSSGHTYKGEVFRSNEEYVDGGLIKNFPIDLFDDRKYVYREDTQHFSPHIPTHMLNRQTLGFAFGGGEEVNPVDSQRDNIFNFAFALLTFYLNAEALSQEEAQTPTNEHRVIQINPRGIDLLSFHMSAEEQVALIAQGRQDTSTFIEHSQDKGYSSEAFRRPATPLLQQHAAIPFRISDLPPEMRGALTRKISELTSALICTTHRRDQIPVLYRDLTGILRLDVREESIRLDNPAVVSALTNLSRLNPVEVDRSFSAHVEQMFSFEHLRDLEVVAIKMKRLFAISSQLLESSQSQSQERGDLSERAWQVLSTSSHGELQQSWMVLQTIQKVVENKMLSLKEHAAVSEKDAAVVEKDAALRENSEKDQLIAGKDEQIVEQEGEIVALREMAAARVPQQPARQTTKEWILANRAIRKFSEGEWRQKLTAEQHAADKSLSNIFHGMPLYPLLVKTRENYFVRQSAPSQGEAHALADFVPLFLEHKPIRGSAITNAYFVKQGVLNRMTDDGIRFSGEEHREFIDPLMDRVLHENPVSVRLVTYLRIFKVHLWVLPKDRWGERENYGVFSNTKTYTESVRNILSECLRYNLSEAIKNSFCR